MTEVVVAVIGLVPLLLGLLNTRQRRLTLIQKEIETLRLVPEDMTESRVQLHERVTASITRYTYQRPITDPLAIQGVTYLALVLFLVGLQLLSGKLPDSHEWQVARNGLGFGLVLAGAALAVLFSFVILFQFLKDSGAGLLKTYAHLRESPKVKSKDMTTEEDQT